MSGRAMTRGSAGLPLLGGRTADLFGREVTFLTFLVGLALALRDRRRRAERRGRGRSTDGPNPRPTP